MFFSINTGYQFSCVFLGFFSNGEEEQIFFRQFLMVNQKYINFLPLHIPSSLYTPIRIHSPLLYPPLNIYPFEHCFPLIWILRPKNLCFCCICTNCLMFTQPPPTKHLVSCFSYPPPSILLLSSLNIYYRVTHKGWDFRDDIFIPDSLQL